MMWNNGVEVGDINHGREFAVMFVDMAYECLLTNITKYLKTTPCGFPIPFSIVLDKDEERSRFEF